MTRKFLNTANSRSTFIDRYRNFSNIIISCKQGATLREESRGNYGNLSNCLCKRPWWENRFLRYVTFDFATLPICIFSARSHQKLKDRHSHVSFLLFIVDKDNNCDLFHWQSIRVTIRQASTEDAKLLAIDAAVLWLRNQSRIIVQLLKWEILVVLYIDNRTLWQNVMSFISLSMPEFMYRCWEEIQNENINSTCLMDGKFNSKNQRKGKS